ncbi:MAG: hypothetical protein AB1744_15395, partial [Candidatus Zixiibacteriota bacterium]
MRLRLFVILLGVFAQLGSGTAEAASSGPPIEVRPGHDWAADVGRAALPQAGRMPGEFTVAEAMRLLYGSFDPGSGTSEWRPGDAVEPLGDYFAQDAHSRFLAEPVLVAPVSAGGKPMRLLVTEASPRGYDCVYCHGLAGVALFEQEGDGWRLVSGNRAAAFSDHGKGASRPYVLQDADDRFWIAIHSRTERGGVGSGSVSLVGMLPDGFKEIF